MSIVGENQHAVGEAIVVPAAFALPYLRLYYGRVVPALLTTATYAVTDRATRLSPTTYRFYHGSSAHQ